MATRLSREELAPYVVKSSWIASKQVSLTLILYVLVWVLYIQTLSISGFLVIPFAVIQSMLVLRFFVLMHDCGHESLYPSKQANKIVGFFLGVITGMPQYVWSKHHAYHHATNGDWEKYKGPLSIMSVEEYNRLSESQKRKYRFFRNPLVFMSLGGFLYVLFNPRFNWLVGVVGLLFSLLKNVMTGNFQEALTLVKKMPSRKWKTPKEFRHMTYNNVVLLSTWFVMCEFIGVYNFFVFYVLTLSIAGSLGILFFTVQHNFENSYASDSANVDPRRASIEGTSYLKLPSVLNWVTADIAYHHIHHLSAAIPNYHLAACHKEFKDQFARVRRISIGDIPHALSFLLWDRENEKLISIK